MKSAYRARMSEKEGDAFTLPESDYENDNESDNESYYESDDESYYESDNDSDNESYFENESIIDDLIEAVIQSPDPDKWVALVDKVQQLIQTTNDIYMWKSVLHAYYKLCKIYESKSPKGRKQYHKAMRVLLPVFLKRLRKLSEDQSEISVVTQKQILKIFFTFIQFFLPLDVLDKQNLSTWIETCNMILAKPVPDMVKILTSFDMDERPELSWWKIKDWAIRILNHVFYRYGTPSNVGKKNAEFANYFLKDHATNILTTVLKILEQYRNGVYTTPGVLQESLVYIQYAVLPAFTWKLLKQHMLVIIKDILYPLMCHSDEDEELFKYDPIEYIEIKCDVLENFLFPANAARQIVLQVAKKRKQMLKQVMLFCIQALQNNQLQPRQKDGILHIIGVVAPVLIKKKIYKEQVEIMLIKYVFPEFQSQHGFLRARACWLLKSFSNVGFKSEENLILACNYTTNCLLNDPCLPVSLEACLALSELIDDNLWLNKEKVNPKVRELIGQNIKPVILKMLKLIRDTKSDMQSVSDVIQNLVMIYEEEITKYSVEIMQHVADTFLSIANFCEENQESRKLVESAVAAVNILQTVDSILYVMKGRLEVRGELEKVIMPIIYAIIQNEWITFYEELFALICDMTSKQISSQMWNVLFLLHDMFEKDDAADNFVKMMPMLHNYVTIDTAGGLLADPKRIGVMFKMIKQVLTNPTEDDEAEAESHAAKLLEIIILECRGKIDHLLPTFLQLVLQRLGREIYDAKLKTMCMQVVVAALWSSTDCVLQTFEASAKQRGRRSFFMEFLEKWFVDIDCCFCLHDRKMYLLGICTLLQIANKRPLDVAKLADKLLPNACVLLESLEKVYANKDKEVKKDSDGDIEDEEDEKDDDEKKGSQKSKGMDSEKEDGGKLDEDSGLDGDDDDDDEFGRTLESYKSCIDRNDKVDEFIIFRDTLKAIQTNEPQFFALLHSSLTPDQVKSIQDYITTANKRQAEKESRKILNAEDYSSNDFQVPSKFYYF